MSFYKKKKIRMFSIYFFLFNSISQLVSSIASFALNVQVNVSSIHP